MVLFLVKLLLEIIKQNGNLAWLKIKKWSANNIDIRFGTCMSLKPLKIISLIVKYDNFPYIKIVN